MKSKQTAVEWLEIQLFKKQGKFNKSDIEQAKEIEEIENLKRQLFIGKVLEIIGFDKTIELLKECEESFKSAL